MPTRSAALRAADRVVEPAGRPRPDAEEAVRADVRPDLSIDGRATAPTAPHSTADHALTGLRAVAAVWVLLFHYRDEVVRLAPALRPLDPLLAAGCLGVDVFFVLSGPCWPTTTPAAAPREAPAFGVLPPLLASPGGLLGRLVALRWFTYWGEASYCLYVTHLLLPVLHRLVDPAVAGDAARPVGLLVLAGHAGVLAAAAVTLRRLVEVPARACSARAADEPPRRRGGSSLARSALSVRRVPPCRVPHRARWAMASSRATSR